MNERKPRQRHKTIMTQLTDVQRDMLKHVHQTAHGPATVPPMPTKSYPAPEVFQAGVASITIDGLGAVSLKNEPFLADMDQLTAAKLIKAIARHVDLHPDAIADFMDDLTEGMEP